MYIPANKTQLLLWFKRNRPGYKVKGMKIKQLYALYYSERRK